MVDALKRASAKRITVVAPFYPYARQDKKGRGREPISARLVADLFKAAGADRIMSVDLHAAQIQGFFDGPVDHLFAMPVLLEHFRTSSTRQPHRRLARTWGACASPTSGATSSAAPLAIIHKRRDPLVPNQVTVHDIVGDVRGRVCLIVDDMIDTGRTIVLGCQGAEGGGRDRRRRRGDARHVLRPGHRDPAVRVHRRGRRHRHAADPAGEALPRAHDPADRAAAGPGDPRGLRGRLGHLAVRRRRVARSQRRRLARPLPISRNFCRRWSRMPKTGIRRSNSSDGSAVFAPLEAERHGRGPVN